MRWKMISALAVGLLLALMLTLYIVLAGYDFNHLKPEIARAVRQATGRELVLGGNIDLKIGLSPRLVVENVSLANASWGSAPHLVKIRRLEVVVALLPLISGELELERLIVLEPEFLLEFSQEGKPNLDFSPKERANQEKEDSGTSQETALSEFTLGELRIENGRLTIKDGRTKETQHIILKSLRSQSKDENSPLSLSLEGVYLEEVFNLKATLGSLADLGQTGKPWPLKLEIKGFGLQTNMDGAIKDPVNLEGLEIKLATAFMLG